MKKLFRCLFSWQVAYPSFEEIERNVLFATQKKQPVVILTHDIGLCEGNTPGRGNRSMALTLARTMRMFPSVPVLAQLGVALALEELGYKATQTIGPTASGTPLDHSTLVYNSHKVVTDQREWLEAHGMFPALALTIATPLHMGRVKWIMEKQGFEMLPVPLPTGSQREYMDPQGLYLSVRLAGKFPGGVLVFFLREVLARLLFLWKGWL